MRLNLVVALNTHAHACTTLGAHVHAQFWARAGMHACNSGTQASMSRHAGMQLRHAGTHACTFRAVLGARAAACSTAPHARACSQVRGCACSCEGCWVAVPATLRARPPLFWHPCRPPLAASLSAVCACRRLHHPAGCSPRCSLVRSTPCSPCCPASPTLAPPTNWMGSPRMSLAGRLPRRSARGCCTCRRVRAGASGRTGYPASAASAVTWWVGSTCLSALCAVWECRCSFQSSRVVQCRCVAGVQRLFVCAALAQWGCSAWAAGIGSILVCAGVWLLVGCANASSLQK